MSKEIIISIKDAEEAFNENPVGALFLNICNQKGDTDLKNYNAYGGIIQQFNSVTVESFIKDDLMRVNNQLKIDFMDNEHEYIYKYDETSDERALPDLKDLVTGDTYEVKTLTDNSRYYCKCINVLQNLGNPWFELGMNIHKAKYVVLVHIQSNGWNNYKVIRVKTGEIVSEVYGFKLPRKYYFIHGVEQYMKGFDYIEAIKTGTWNIEK